MARSRSPALLLLLALAATAMGCEETRLEETRVVLGWTVPEVAACVEPPSGETGGVDTYLVDLFAYEGPIEPPGPSASPCRYCAEGQEERAHCELLSRQCLCSGERDTDALMLDALRQQRFADVPADRPLCLRLIALPREGAPGGPATGPAEPCGEGVSECSLDVAAEVASRARLCAVSDLGDLSSSEAPLVVRDLRCRSIDLLLTTCNEHPDDPDYLPPRWCNSLCLLMPSLCEGIGTFLVQDCAAFTGD